MQVKTQVKQTEDNSANAPFAAADQPDQDMQRLRDLLLGKDYQALLELRQQLNTPELHSEKVAEVVSEAIRLRTTKDESLSDVLTPTIENALSRSIEKDPQRLADALYPVMGPAIRKSIQEALTQTFETFNQLLEQSLSPRFLRWRFDAWRTGRSYSEVVLLNTLEYQVEQVFLIHRETGLLLRHAEAPRAISKDPDMVSGMLTAIQNFIADSFALQDGGTLNELRLGELTVLVEQGPYAVLAVVVRGNPPAGLTGLLDETVEQIHQQMGNTLLNYSGDSEPFVRIHPLLEACLISRRQKRQRGRPWLLYGLLTVLLSLISWLGLQYYQDQQQAQRIVEQQQLIEQQRLVEEQRLQQLAAQTEQQQQQRIEQIDSEPGVVVLSSEKTDNGYRIRGLLDPLARHPQTFVEPLDVTPPGQTEQQPVQLEFVFRPYLSAEPEMLLRHAGEVLQPPPGVRLQLNDGVLKVSGTADPAWRDRLDTYWLSQRGVSRLDDSQLRVTDPVAVQIRKLQREIQQRRYQFDVLGQEINGQPPHFLQQAQAIQQLIRLTAGISKTVRVTVSGNTDGSGTPLLNEKLSRQRAASARDLLVQLGVPANVLVMAGPGQSGFSERSISYTVRVK